jgi:group I intron endonuclease
MVIYRLISPSGKSYIGLTKDFKRRLKEHILASKNGNYAIHAAIRKYGINSFQKEILYETEVESELIEKEKHFIEYYKSYSKGYNQTKGGAWVNVNHSFETKQKISNATKGKKKDYKPWNYGKKHSEETKQKIREKRKLQVFSKESNKKRADARRGKKQTEFQKQRMTETFQKRWVITFPDGHKERIINLKNFCKKHNLQDSNLIKTQKEYKKRLNHHKGFTCEKDL